MGVEVRINSVDVESKTDHQFLRHPNGQEKPVVVRNRLMVRIEGEVVGDHKAGMELVNLRGVSSVYISEEPTSARIRTEAEIEEERGYRIYAEQKARDHLEKIGSLQAQLTEQKNRADVLERELTSLKILNGVQDTW